MRLTFVRRNYHKIRHRFRVHLALGAPSARRRHRADPAPPRAEVQRGQDDLPQVLRPPPPQGHQLQEEVVSCHYLLKGIQELDCQDPYARQLVFPSVHLISSI